MCAISSLKSSRSLSHLLMSSSYLNVETKTPLSLTADDLACHFVAKTNRIDASTATSALPVIVDRAFLSLSDLSSHCRRSGKNHIAVASQAMSPKSGANLARKAC